MKYYLLNICFAIITVIFLAGCSELDTNNIAPQTKKIAVHPEGFITPSSADFHGKVIKAENWDMSKCEQCHAADFSGGTTGKSCLTCHTGSKGPLACNTCHGDFNDPSHIAPPRDIEGNTSTGAPGVGAHEKHLYTNTIGNKVKCSACHNVPQSVYAQGHLDTGLPAEINFKGQAVLGGITGATFNYNSFSCSNTYCHGNFNFSKTSAPAEDQFAFVSDMMSGNNATVDWITVNGTQDKCGSCHDLPPKGHIGHGTMPVKDCVGCHYGVVDSEGNIIDNTKHINGEVNVRGN